MRPSNRTTLSMACEAIRNAMGDAGLTPLDIDGMTSYQAGDSTSSAHVASALASAELLFDILGGGSSTRHWSRTQSGSSRLATRNDRVLRSMNGRSGAGWAGKFRRAIPAPMPTATTSSTWMGLTCRAALRHVRDALSTRHRITTKHFAEIAWRIAITQPQPEGDLSLAITIEITSDRMVVKPFRLLDA